MVLAGFGWFHVLGTTLRVCDDEITQRTSQHTYFFCVGELTDIMCMWASLFWASLLVGELTGYRYKQALLAGASAASGKLKMISRHRSLN